MRSSRHNGSSISSERCAHLPPAIGAPRAHSTHPARPTRTPWGPRIPRLASPARRTRPPHSGTHHVFEPRRCSPACPHTQATRPHRPLPTPVLSNANRTPWRTLHHLHITFHISTTPTPHTRNTTKRSFSNIHLTAIRATTHLSHATTAPPSVLAKHIHPWRSPATHAPPTPNHSSQALTLPHTLEPAHARTHTNTHTRTHARAREGEGGGQEAARPTTSSTSIFIILLHPPVRLGWIGLGWAP